MDTPGGPQEMSTVTESGLYTLIFKSRKPVAKRFRKWVTSEVLPEIRRKGFYVRQGDESRVIASLQSQLRQLADRQIEMLRLVGARPYGLLGDDAPSLLARIRDLRDEMMTRDGVPGSKACVQRIADNRVRYEVGYPAGAWKHCPSDRANAAHSFISRELEAIHRRCSRKVSEAEKAKQNELRFNGVN